LFAHLKRILRLNRLRLPRPIGCEGRFLCESLEMVGDRGVLTSARIEQTLRPAGLD
jgi:hypothetical protein